jgi:hypothetical protein
VKKTLTARHGREFVKHVVPAVLKPARTLWNEVIGFFFVCLAVLFGSGAIRSYFAFVKATPEQAPGDLLRLLMASFCTLLMLYFGVSSFMKARKISRS